MVFGKKGVVKVGVFKIYPKSLEIKACNITEKLKQSSRGVL